MPGSDDESAIKKIEAVVDVDETGKLRVRGIKYGFKPRPMVNGKFVKSWSTKCVKPLRGFCSRALTGILSLYTGQSVGSMLNEVVERGLRVEVALALALMGNEELISKYLSDGSYDAELVTRVINSTVGARFTVNDVKMLLDQGPTVVNRPRSVLGFLRDAVGRVRR